MRNSLSAVVRVAGFVSVVVVVLTAGCRPSVTPAPPPPPQVDIEALRPRVVAFCGDCHAVPDPATFPRDAWHDEVALGYNFYRESGRHDLDEPPMSQVVAYYRALAPKELATGNLASGAEHSDSPGPLKFRPEAVAFRPPPDIDDNSPVFPGVSYLGWSTASRELGGLLMCDMRVGLVQLAKPGAKGPAELQPLVKIPNPAHVEPCDLDRDGKTDLLIADLGSFQPADHEQGRVLWARRNEDGSWRVDVLAEKLGRVADVRFADFDGDDDLDLVVAEFGWRKTGRTLMLWQDSVEQGVPQFRTEVLDPRHGAIHVPVADLNADGQPDIVVLVSQEHEMVEALINDGLGKFRRETLFAAGDPSFGSSGIQVVDLDGDGDQDVLYTNGDTLDSFHVKPYHAVHWLENPGDGSFPFRPRELTRMPGVYRAVAADLDGDGDQDVVAAAYLPEKLLRSHETKTYDALIWLQQTSPGQFTRHRIQHAASGHLSVEAGDFDNDGDIDLAAGHYGDAKDWVTFWWNE